jgi:hypothetical protein
VKLQDKALALPSPPWGDWRQALSSGVRPIGKILPEVLNRYGLLLDPLDVNKPPRSTAACVPSMPRSDLVLEPIVSGNA